MELQPVMLRQQFASEQPSFAPLVLEEFVFEQAAVEHGYSSASLVAFSGVDLLF